MKTDDSQIPINDYSARTVSNFTNAMRLVDASQ